LGERAIDRNAARIFTTADTFRDDHLHLRANKAEDGAEQRLGIFVRRIGGARAINIAASEGDDHAFPLRKSYGAILTVAERLAAHCDAINPGLELAGNGKIVEAGADYHDVSFEELLHVLSLVQRREGIERQMGERFSDKIAVGDVDKRRLLMRDWSAFCMKASVETGGKQMEAGEF